ncbi:MAG TPA: beta-propeller fold lactonase family protein [Terracidiphilus sp.]|nr:beta-propeller fold lactonase family protein [Terracidiphilus sp.]
MRISALFVMAGGLWLVGVQTNGAQTIDLPSSKQLLEPVPGSPQRLNSLPMSMAISPDGRYVVTVNSGYGTYESKYEQSLAVFDTQTGKLTDFPDDRTSLRAKQTLYSGLAFSRDGSHVYASIGSETDPEGKLPPSRGLADTGSGIVVYRFAEGKIEPERLIHLPLDPLAPGHTTKLIGEVEGNQGVPFPAAITVVETGGTEKLLVAENLTDDVLLIDPATGKIEHRFDLTESEVVPSTYPIALEVSKDGRRAFVALWNASEIVELDLDKAAVGRKLALLKPTSTIKPGTHPCAFALSGDGRTLYVALANRDAVAAVNVGAGQFAVKGYFDTRLPGQSYFGAEPVALALNASGTRLYVANMGSDAVAVIDTKKLTEKTSKTGMVEPEGFVPTEWMPISMAYQNGKLFVATDKGKGTVPNPNPPKDQKPEEGMPKKTNYIATLLHGSFAALNEAEIEHNLAQSTQAVLETNRMKAAAEKITFGDGTHNRIKHVIYIIKENRTYDQILGDLEQNGKPVGNGDKSLTMFGAEVTPNEHRLALQFGVLDNFYDSGEVSGDGHVWSNAAIGTDYLEKTWQQAYRGGERTYDFEGVVAEGLPLEQKIPDVNEPASGYLWGNLAAHGKTYYHFGEFISSVFCDEKQTTNPQQGPVLPGQTCAREAIAPGQEFPAEWGGGANKWPWPVPLIASNTATKPELVGHFAKESPDFNLAIPDQIRVEIFLLHLKQWEADLKNGKDTMPNFIQLRLPDDHTNGTAPFKPTPKASVADNDLAVGRAVDAISHSPFWDDTAFFILEDDAQAGADHVDAHRSVALVVSKYAPKAKDGRAIVDSRFYSTVSVIRTMETLLGLPPMNNNDAFSSLISMLFTGPGDQPAYSADTMNRDNGLIYAANPKKAVGAEESMKMDFRHADRAPTQKLNVILWKDTMGSKPVPAMLTEKRKLKKDDDD